MFATERQMDDFDGGLQDPPFGELACTGIWIDSGDPFYIRGIVWKIQSGSKSDFKNISGDVPQQRPSQF
jgi:hypothetical protein